MRDETEVAPTMAGEGVIVWASERTALTVLLGIPGVCLSAAFTGLLVSVFFDPPVALVVALAAACAITVVRIIMWTRGLAKRTVAVTDTHLEVRRGTKVLDQMAWSDIGSIALVRGESLWRMTFDITSSFTSFPYIVAKPRDIWDVRGALPSVLAVLPSEFWRLESALREMCAARSLPFSVDSGE